MTTWLRFKEKKQGYVLFDKWWEGKNTDRQIVLTVENWNHIFHTKNSSNNGPIHRLMSQKIGAKKKNVLLVFSRNKEITNCARSQEMKWEKKKYERAQSKTY